MKNNTKPSLGEKPDHINLQVVTNGLNSDKVLDRIAKYIIDLTIAMKSSSKNISAFNMIMNNHKYNDNAMEVNRYIN